ncbi:MAG: thioredoxin domain-containing protein, partial [Syntrophobacteraceae bacterium]|nr:thioredoxin domain-containing protein [Desulfobacteraceae bacterium]
MEAQRSKPNRLIHEKSPYLLQHASNPVDWYPWGEEAFRKAKEEDKPVFLSVGYATCHWCHVMERESFEDAETAELLNRNVVSVKVDREERPDIDRVYMSVCQALTGRGGWPLTIFMTPDRLPFFAGGYFPKSSRMGMPGFQDIIRHFAGLWKTNREAVVGTGDRIAAGVQPATPPGGARLPGLDILRSGYDHLRRSFDGGWGGFGPAPKFPTPHRLTFLLRWHGRRPDSDAAEMLEATLDAMRAGGLFDQVGYGFHRYSVDERWLVPHFEKMLYDQALLAIAYLEAFLATGWERHGRVAREIFEYVLRDMTDGDGGFYSAEDADSEGEEGKFYVWTPGEVADVLGREAGEVFCRFYDITPEGNFEGGASIPHVSLPVSAAASRFGTDEGTLERLLEEGRKKLFAAREKRVRPLRDDKILTAWNGLMIAALAKGAQALGEPAYAEAASRAADFILTRLRRPPSGRLYRRFRQGDVAHPAFADDYAFLIWGLLELYEATFDTERLVVAVELQESMNGLFLDEAAGGYFYTARNGEGLFLRDKEIYDGATPSSNSVAALNLLRLARMTGDARLEETASKLLSAFHREISDYPSGYTQFLQAVDFALGPSREIVVAGDPDTAAVREMLAVIRAAFMPNRVVMLRKTGAESPLLFGLAPFMKEM